MSGTPNLLTQGTAQAGAFSTGGVSDYWKALAIGSTPTGSEQDTGYDLPANAELLEVRIKVLTAEATGGTKTLDIGLLSGESGGDADGFVDGASVAATGVVRPAATVIDGASEEYLGSTTLGVFFDPVFSAGANSAGDVGTSYPRSFLTSSVTSKSVSYTAGSNDWAEFRGTIYLHIREYA